MSKHRTSVCSWGVGRSTHLPSSEHAGMNRAYGGMIVLSVHRGVDRCVQVAGTQADEGICTGMRHMQELNRCEHA